LAWGHSSTCVRGGGGGATCRHRGGGAATHISTESSESEEGGGAVWRQLELPTSCIHEGGGVSGCNSVIIHIITYNSEPEQAHTQFSHNSHIEAHIYNYIIMFMHYIMHIKFTCSHKFNIYNIYSKSYTKSHSKLASRWEEAVGRPLDDYFLQV
jgi:hypothetical protein